MLTAAAATSYSTCDDACIDRSKFQPIKVIVHGDTYHDPVWKQIIMGMNDMSKIVGIPIDIIDTTATAAATTTTTTSRSTSNTSFSITQMMVIEIQKYATTSSNVVDGVNDNNNSNNNKNLPPPSAMIVSLTGDPRIEEAIKLVQATTRIPIFGINAIPLTATNNKNNNKNSPSSSTIDTKMMLSPSLVSSSSSTSSTSYSSSSSSPLSLHGAVYMNDTYAGKVAGKYIQELIAFQQQQSDSTAPLPTATKGHYTGIYINRIDHRSNVNSIIERFNSITETTNDSIQSWEMIDLNNYHHDDGDNSVSSSMVDKLTSLFDGCTYDIVQLGSISTTSMNDDDDNGGDGSIDTFIDAIIQALVANGCNIGGGSSSDNENSNNNNDNNAIIIGTFDTSPLIHDAIAVGTISYTISQQPYSQGSYSVLQAALATITNTNYQGDDPHQEDTTHNNKKMTMMTIETGPIVITSENIDDVLLHEQPQQQQQQEQPRHITDRSSEISIAVVSHDVPILPSSSTNTIRNGDQETSPDNTNSSSRNGDTKFWDTIYSGISQAVADLGIRIQKNRYISPHYSARTTSFSSSHHAGRGGGGGFLGNTGKAVSLKHNLDISEACSNKRIDGVIVTVPDISMIDSLLLCQSRGIPFLIMNANAAVVTTTTDIDNNDNSNRSTIDDDDDDDDDDDPTTTAVAAAVLRPVLPYIGQNDYETGYDAGRRLIDSGVIKGWCLIHANFDTLKERCRGMKAAFLDKQEVESNNDVVQFMDVIPVPSDGNIATYKYIVETIINKIDGNHDDDKNDWDGHGLLSTGRVQIPSIVSLVNDHSKVVAGTFDTDPSLYTTRDSSSSSSTDELQPVLHDQIIFAIDQNEYIQGYLSVATLVTHISTLEVPTNDILETGPTFIVDSNKNLGDTNSIISTNGFSPSLRSSSTTTSTEMTTTMTSKPSSPHQLFCRETNYRMCDNMKGTKSAITMTATNPDKDYSAHPLSGINNDVTEEGPPLKVSGKCGQLGRLCGVCEGKKKKG